MSCEYLLKVLIACLLCGTILSCANHVKNWSIDKTFVQTLRTFWQCCKLQLTPDTYYEFSKSPSENFQSTHLTARRPLNYAGGRLAGNDMLSDLIGKS